ncbi:MAG TPA: TonB-dependent receptor [Bacteroidetes bacterium]|nr:TonB-dependent receptor [Bacteroidota bacterium]
MMNRIFTILLLILLSAASAYSLQPAGNSTAYFCTESSAIPSPARQSSRDDHPLITASYKNTPFKVFVSDLKERYGITIYFRPEWVEELTVTASGDSIHLGTLLEDILSPLDLHFVYRGKGQYFLTGTVSITGDFMAVTTEPEEPDPGPEPGDITGQYSYEKKIRHATVGSPENVRTGLALLSGRITSATSGEPVPGATVIIEGTSKGEISDGEGFYAMRLEAGETYNLTVSCMGMEKETYILDFNSTGTLNIELQEQLIDIREVVVKSGRHDNVRGMQMGFQRIDIREIKSIPVVMGERDILKVAQLMPGVQNVGEGSSGFNVRGSGSDQNLFLINEVPVLNTGHLFGFFSAFNSDMISDFTLYKNNFPVEYGGRLASIFEISTRKGNKKKFGARGGISPVTASLLAETPIVNDRSSIVFAGRSTYSDWILKRLDSPELKSSNGSFYDLMTSIHVIPSESSSLQVFGYYSKDRFALAGTDRYMYENAGSSVVYDRKLNERWTMSSAAVFSRYTNQHTSIENPFTAWQHRFIVNHRELKTRVTGYKWSDHTITAGAGIISYALNQGSYDPYGNESILAPLSLGREQGLELSFYGADEYAIGDRLTLYGGIRLNLYKYLGPNNIYTYSPSLPKAPEHITDTTSYKALETIENRGGPDYRISANYTFSPTASVKVSFNRMRQYLFMLSNTIAISPTDRWKLADPHIEPPLADQFSLGFYKNLPRRALEISAELYYKKTQNQVEYRDGADLILNPLFETAVVRGEQEGWGAEILLKRNAGRLTGWMSYTYSRSFVRVNGENSWEKINDGNVYPSNYDKPHSFNFVGTLRISRRFSISGNVVYSTGRPITYPTGLISIDGERGIIYSGRNEYRIPDYFRADVSLNIEGNLLKEKFAHGSWMISVYNVTGRRNAYSVYFKNEGGSLKGYKLSIYGTPIFTVSYNFKLGNYAVN